ncbi:hypothetical protein J40TS1_00490 [Paenibacillus montaniterrae]|uniref:Phage protein n=1 Tax=Paenibacillus montaniterrae TaxID=429341 RepID=A0A920CS39_9BACL|nr:hypothetical protein [Paenibacillus montaniterrae]GIP14407.1 hypothetical protein J40TS1_00490 [Paenibacillus montaniterrae]
MSRYRKKPVEVEAFLYTGDVGEVYDRLGDKMTQPVSGKVGIVTLEGIVYASPGDYIIKGVKGEFYPCKPDIFELTYEAVKDESNEQR